MSRATAYKPTARRVREETILIAMGSLRISMRKQRPFLRQVSRWCRWMRKRKNWWAISRMLGANGVRRGNRKRCVSTTSPSLAWGERLLMGCTTWDRMRAGSMWGWTMTAAFAVESLRRWWKVIGQQQYPQAKRLLISADGGGSNGSRVRLWKWELQQLADETGLEIG